MELEEFLSYVKPATRRSKLEPYLDDLRHLRELGYTLSQMQSYLAGKEVHATIQTISAYLKKRDGQQLSKKPDQNAKSQSLELVTRPIEETSENQETGGKSEDFTHFNPSELRNILDEEIDLDALAKIGKEQHRKRKKHESSRD
ncbi:hypothetical protein RO575_22430 [Methylomonas sp. MO1]|uniref:hypothetical protein n=1 Tax=Methylomonas sp. MO1 TaxID=3073619 RepID=UPI0028A55797|nr:hypothetical protein [Methylomonas sp. MO1]MDT4292332.1 hypothetical protein [Methylomonas sp. MO1]